MVRSQTSVPGQPLLLDNAPEAAPGDTPGAASIDAPQQEADAEATGLQLHMTAVRTLHARALTADLLDAAGVELVHDLRVAIRRCRSLAQGLAAVDVSQRRLWRRVSAVGRPLFAGLGALRDTQVMRQWVETLVGGETRLLALAHLDDAMVGRHLEAVAAVAAFDTAAWDALTLDAPTRADVMLRRRPALTWLALVRWQEARALHIRAMQSRQSADLHAVRIGVKRLRYTLESLLPERHAAVAKPLKKLQDVLGDIHDIDVVGEALAAVGDGAVVAAPEDTAGVDTARAERLLVYKTMATGRQSLWTMLRAALPTSPDVLARCRRAYLMEVAESLGAHDKTVRHAERAVRALELALGEARSTERHQATALLAAGAKPKRMRRATATLLGFSADERRRLRKAIRRDALARAAAGAARSHDAHAAPAERNQPAV